MKRFLTGSYCWFIFFAALLWMAGGCSPTQKTVNLTTNELFSDPSSFSYYPAMLVLPTGDTVSGRFTKIDTLFLWIHENNDSNYNTYHRAKSLWTRATYYYYYKKFYGSTVAAYTVNEHRYEPVIIINKNADSTRAVSEGYRHYMEKLTTGTSSMQLYRGLAPVERRDENEKVTLIGVLVEMLTRYDTTIGSTDYTYTYFMHFPGGHPLLVWNVDDPPVTKRLKETISGSVNDCPALAATARQLQQADKPREIIKVLVRPDSVIQTKGLRALLARIEIYNECYKNKFR